MLLIYSSVFIALITIKVIMRKKNRTETKIETSGWEPSWCNWSKSSAERLSNTEKEILSCLKIEYRERYVDIGPIVGDADRIWTLSFNENSPKTPIVLLHGLGSGVALWVTNIKELAKDRPVYLLDVLGFGRSSRPKFSSKGKIVEMQFVAFFEEWRREMNLDKFILLGHSLGGYISALYTMQYPEKVKHLILADSWGLSECPENVFDHYKIPIWARIIIRILLPLNPLWALRLAGPWGESLIGKTRSLLVTKFSPFVPNANVLIPRYIHQCNCQTPSGESAFHSMMHFFIFSKNPIITRKHRLNPNIGITMIFGANSWVNNKVGEELKDDQRKVDVHIIPKSAHHVYLDQYEIFNSIISEACLHVDENNQI